MDEAEQRAVKDGPQIKQDTWFALAIAAFLITVVIFDVAAMWIVSAPALEMVQRAQSFTPFGAGMVAIVTFFTIAWRGVINTRQLEYQADQIEQVRRQVDATDDANYAKLLQEGAKLLAEDGKQPQILAGVATLEILIAEPKRRFSIEAMDLLAGFVMENYGKQPLNWTNRAAMRGLLAGERLGLQSRLDGVLERQNSDPGYWAYVPGMRSLTFPGGSMSAKVYDRSRPKIRKLERVSIHGVEFDEDLSATKCTFTSCTVRRISAWKLTRFAARPAQSLLALPNTRTRPPALR